MKEKVILSMGANLGDREETLRQAVTLLENSHLLSDIKVSSFYETEPVGYENQPNFINIAISGLCKHSPEMLFYFLKGIEYIYGRQKRNRWHERELDIDLIAFGNKIIDNPKLTIPHPRMHERMFVLEPLREIDSDFVHPISGMSVAELMELLKRID